MFGCELPVIAYKRENFVALPELVVDGFTGKVFTSPEELSMRLREWFNHFPSNSYEERKNDFKNNIKAFKGEKWEEHWEKVAKPFFVNT